MIMQHVSKTMMPGCAVKLFACTIGMSSKIHASGHLEAIVAMSYGASKAQCGICPTTAIHMHQNVHTARST